jgi:hypothetical protein
VPGAGIEDGAVVLQEMEEAAARVDRARVVESQGVPHMLQNRGAAMKVWRRRDRHRGRC